MKASSAHNAVSRADVDTLSTLLEDADTLDCLTAVIVSSFPFPRKISNYFTAQAGWTLLHTAAQHDHDTIGEILLAKGMSVNASGMVGESPLHVCAMFGSKRMAELLLNYNADPEQVCLEH